jgi:hypothetical protein
MISSLKISKTAILKSAEWYSVEWKEWSSLKGAFFFFWREDKNHWREEQANRHIFDVIQVQWNLI